MPKKIGILGKIRILEITDDYITFSFKCYLCKHWTVVREDRVRFEHEFGLEGYVIGKKEVKKND